MRDSVISDNLKLSIKSSAVMPLSVTRSSGVNDSNIDSRSLEFTVFSLGIWS